MEGITVEKDSNQRASIIGGGNVGFAISVDKNQNTIHKTNKHGVFIFSWSHPIHKCVAVEGDMLSFKKCYFDESWYSVSLDGDAISLSDRKLSTYVNALAKTGFVIEEMIEESDNEIFESIDSKFAQKSKMLPVTFVISVSKLRLKSSFY